MFTPAALLALAALAPSDPDRLLVAVPEDAMVVLSLASLDEIRQRGAENAWWKLVQAEELQPFLARAGELFTQAMDEAFSEEEAAQRELSDPRNWLDCVHGPAVAFLSLTDPEHGSGGLLVEPGADAAAFDARWQALIEQMRKDCTESTQEYRDAELLVLENKDADSGTIILFEAAGARAIVLGTDRALVLELAQGGIDRLLGHESARGFAGASALSDARRGTVATPAFEAFVDVGALVRFGMTVEENNAAEHPESAASPEEIAHVRQIMEKLGLLTMRYAYFAAALGAGERFDLAFALHLPAGSWLQRLSALLKPAPRELLALAPADARGVSIGALDVAGVWTLLRTAIGETDAAALEQMDTGVSGFEGMFGLTLEHDLLQQFSGGFGTMTVAIPPDEVPEAVRALGPGAEEYFSSASATVVQVEDGSELEDVLARVLRGAGVAGMVEEDEDYQGHTVQRMGPPGSGLTWSFTDEFLVVSQFPTPLRSVLARIGTKDMPSLASDARFRAILEQNPRASVISISDARSTTQTLLGVIRVIAGAIPAEEEGEIGEDVLELLQLFPEPSFVGKHIEGVLFSALEAQPEGLLMHVGGR